jgi:hypothetical protein
MREGEYAPPVPFFGKKPSPARNNTDEMPSASRLGPLCSLSCRGAKTVLHPRRKSSGARTGGAGQRGHRVRYAAAGDTVVKQSIEITHLVNGEVMSVRHLSRRRERREVAVALAIVAGAFVAATGLVAVTLIGTHRIVYGPLFFAAWTGAALAMAFALGWRALDRARRYTVGASIDDDAFAAAPIDLVRRFRNGYQLTILPGMTGTVATGRAPIPVEGLVRENAVRLPLESDMRADLTLAGATFVVRGADEPARAAPLSRALIKRFARPTLTLVQLMAVASFLCAEPVGATITEADMRSAIPLHATPWEAEKMLRAQAQQQARTLHRCFDEMPMECQRPGYVGIGLSLARDGEIRSNWIARSTYGKDCPVNQCMADVAAGWFFEPLPESMQVILPVQVLRTDRPLLRAPGAAHSGARASVD